MGFQCCWTVRCMDLFQKLGKEWEGGHGYIVVLVVLSSVVFSVVEILGH